MISGNMCTTINLHKLRLSRILDNDTLPLIITVNMRKFFIDWTMDKKQLQVTLFDGKQIYGNAITADYKAVISLMDQIIELSESKGDCIALYSVKIGKQVVEFGPHRHSLRRHRPPSPHFYPNFLRLSKVGNGECVCTKTSGKHNKITAHSMYSLTNIYGLGSQELPLIGQPQVANSTKPSSLAADKRLGKSESTLSGTPNQQKISIKVMPDMKVIPKPNVPQRDSTLKWYTKNDTPGEELICSVLLEDAPVELTVPGKEPSLSMPHLSAVDSSDEGLIETEETPLAIAGVCSLATDQSPAETAGSLLPTEGSCIPTAGSPQEGRIGSVKAPISIAEVCSLAPEQCPIETMVAPGLPIGDRPINDEDSIRNEVISRYMDIMNKMETKHRSEILGHDETNSVTVDKPKPEEETTSQEGKPSTNQCNNLPSTLAKADAHLETAEIPKVMTVTPLDTAGSTTGIPLTRATVLATDEEKSRSVIISKYKDIMSNMEPQNTNQETGAGVLGIDETPNNSKSDGRVTTARDDISETICSSETTARENEVNIYYHPCSLLDGCNWQINVRGLK